MPTFATPEPIQAPSSRSSGTCGSPRRPHRDHRRGAAPQPRQRRRRQGRRRDHGRLHEGHAAGEGAQIVQPVRSQRRDRGDARPACRVGRDLRVGHRRRLGRGSLGVCRFKTAHGDILLDRRPARSRRPPTSGDIVVEHVGAPRGPPGAARCGITSIDGAARIKNISGTRGSACAEASPAQLRQRRHRGRARRPEHLRAHRVGRRRLRDVARGEVALGAGRGVSCRSASARARPRGSTWTPRPVRCAPR